jgi:trehalose 6-phosphate synthase
VELGDSLLVNPYDIEGVAEAIHRGLEMARGERRMRMQRMRKYVREHNVYRWAASILGDLRELPMRETEELNRSQVGPAGIRAVDGGHRRLA